MLPEVATEPFITIKLLVHVAEYMQDYQKQK